MRLLSRVCGIFALVAFLLVSRSADAQEIAVSEFVGSGANLSYFVLDFKGGSLPQSYVLGYRYDGAKTGGDMLDALDTLGGLNVTTQSFGGFGRFISGMGYDGKFRDSSPPNPNAYWSYWLGTSLVGSPNVTWNESQVGLDSRALTNGSWDGWSWVQDFNTVTPAPPIVPVSANAPEPASLLLMVVAMGGCRYRYRSRRR
jgi:hypothetical protein